MHNRHGIIGKSVIDSVRRSLQNKYAEDRHIQHMIEELDASDDLTYEELHMTKQAYEEVKSRLFYTALLDSLWQEISETQDLLAQLHVYDSLEAEFQSEGAALTNEEMDIAQVDLDDVDIMERSLAVRQTSALAERPTVAGNLVAANATEGVKAILTEKMMPAEGSEVSATKGSDDEEVHLTKAHSVEEREIDKADNSKAVAHEADKHTGKVQSTGESALQDVLHKLSEKVSNGETGQLIIEELMEQKEWKELKKLAKEAKKALKKTKKTAKKEAKKLAKHTKKETKKTVKKAKQTKQDIESMANSWYEDIETVGEELGKAAKSQVQEAKSQVKVATDKADMVKENIQDLGRSAVLQVLDIVESAIQKKPKK